MRHPFSPPIVRLRVEPDPATQGPPPVAGGRPKGSKRPHTNATVARVRHLIEHTTLTYSEIVEKTGVGRASVCRWTRDGNWTRPFNAPRATDLMPSARAGQKLKLRRLAERLRLIAEHYVRQLEADPAVAIDTLMEALQVLRMARCEAQGRRRRRRLYVGPPSTGSSRQEREDAVRTALKEMRRYGVDLDRAPQEALDLVTDANLPPEDHMMLKPPRGSRGRRG